MLIDSNIVLGKGELVLSAPKNGETGSVPMPWFIAEILRLLVKGRPPTAFVFGSDSDSDSVPRAHAEYSWFASAVKAAMAADTELPRITPHNLRHTAAPLAVSAGANVKLVQRMLGHKSAAMTLDIQSDLFEQDVHRVSEVLTLARPKALALAT